MAVEISAEFLKTISDRQEAKRKQIAQYHLEGAPVQVPTRDGSIKCLIYRPENCEGKLPVFFDIHGGGFTNGFAETDDQFSAKVSRTLNICVISIDYRLAPQYKYPCGLHDCFDAIAYICSREDEYQIDASRMAVGGHSAGGNLTAAVMVMLTENPAFSPKCLILDYPPMDLYTRGEDKPVFEGGIAPELANIFNACYRDEEYGKDSCCSPGFASDEVLKAFPPTMILTAEYDSLRDEAEEFALRLIRNGIPVTAQRYYGVRHGFTIDDFDHPESQKAHDFMMQMLKNYIVSEG